MKFLSKKIIRLILAVSLCCFVTRNLRADNLIINGDFTSGYTAFTTDYTTTGANTLVPEGRYAVGSDIHYYRTDGAFDGVVAQSGAGTNFFMANGSPNTSDTVWQTSSLIQVTEPNTAYRFEVYVTSLVDVNLGSASPLLSFELGDGTTWIDLGSTIEFENGTSKGDWDIFYVDGEFSTAGNYYLRLMNDQSAAGGNDFGLDSIYFGLAVSAPSVGENPVEDDVDSYDTDSMTTAVPDIDTDKAAYTVTELLANQVGRTFDGGTLQEDTGGRDLSGDFIILSSNGTIDTNGYDLTISGDISGAGELTKTSAGTLTLSGTNSYTGGTTVSAGTLTGTTTTLQGDIVNNSAVVFSQPSDGTYSDVMSGTGALTKGGSWTLTLSGTNTHTGNTVISAGTLILDGAVGGSLLINGGTLQGNGTVGDDLTIGANGTHAPGNSIGTTTVLGDYTLSGTLDAEVSKTAGGTLLADLVDVSGSATLESGSQIEVTELPAGGTIVNDEQFKIISTGDGITDNGVTVTSQSDFLVFAGSIIGNDYYVTSHVTSNFATQAVGRNNTRVATSLDADSADSTGDFSTIFNYLLLMSADNFNAAARQMNAEPHLALQYATMRDTHRHAENLAGYLSQRRGDHYKDTNLVGSMPMLANSGDGGGQVYTDASAGSYTTVNDKSWRFFARPFMACYEEGSSTDRLGYTGNSYGAQFGMDRIIAPGLIGGVAVGYTETELNFDGHRGDGETMSIRVGPYATWYCGRWSLDAAASYGYHRNEVERNINFTSPARKAKSKYDAHEGSLYLGGQYNVDFCGITVSPTASLQYICHWQEAFTENGADSINLRNKSAMFHSMRSRVGLRVAKEFDVCGVSILPEVTAGWARENLGGQTINSRFSSGVTSFDTTADDPARNSAYIGAAVAIFHGKNISFDVRYEGEISGSTSDHSFGIGMKWDF